MSQGGVIDCLQFAQAARMLRGVLRTDQLVRLAAMQGGTGGLEYCLRGGRAGNGRLCLWLSISGQVQLPCQRCLDPLEVAIAIEAELQLAESMSEIAAADDDIDRVLASRRTDVAQLVEDEVILALPMVPRHEACSPSLPTVRV